MEDKIFYAPDSFERDSVLTYCTAVKGDCIEGTTVTTSATNNCLAIADYVDTASLGYKSIKVTVDDFQDQIDSLKDAVEKLEDQCRAALLKDNRSKRDKLRSKLCTLKYGYEVL